LVVFSKTVVKQYLDASTTAAVQRKYKKRRWMGGKKNKSRRTEVGDRVGPIVEKKLKRRQF